MEYEVEDVVGSDISSPPSTIAIGTITIDHEHCAIIIQCAVRGFLCRQKLLQRGCSAKRIQSAIRKFLSNHRRSSIQLRSRFDKVLDEIKISFVAHNDKVRMII